MFLNEETQIFERHQFFLVHRFTVVMIKIPDNFLTWKRFVKIS